MNIIILNQEESNTLRYKLLSDEIYKRATILGVLYRDGEHIVVLKHRNGQEQEVQALELSDFELIPVPMCLNSDFTVFDHKIALLEKSTLPHAFLEALDGVMVAEGVS